MDSANIELTSALPESATSNKPTLLFAAQVKGSLAPSGPDLGVLEFGHLQIESSDGPQKPTHKRAPKRPVGCKRFGQVRLPAHVGALPCDGTARLRAGLCRDFRSPRGCFGTRC